MATTYITYAIETLTGRGLPAGVDADGYDTYLAAAEMAEDQHDGEYRIVQPCAYCDRMVEAHRDDSVADVGDDAEWARLAKDHADDCEWITTRAHRRYGAEAR